MPHEFQEEDRLFAARRWQDLLVMPASAGSAFRAVAELAGHADDVREPPAPWALPFLDSLIDAAWLLTNVDREIRSLSAGWEPSAHVAVHLAHRTAEVLLGAYFGLEFGPDVYGDPGREAVCRALQKRLSGSDRYAPGLLGYVSFLKTARGSAGTVTPLQHPSALEIAKLLEPLGLWKALNTCRNQGLLGHGRGALDEFVQAWRSVVIPDRTPAQRDQDVDGEPPDTAPQPSDPASSVPDEVDGDAGNIAHRRSRAKPRPKQPVPRAYVSDPLWADALTDCHARIVRVAEKCVKLTESPRWDDPKGSDLVKAIRWDKLEFSSLQGTL